MGFISEYPASEKRVSITIENPVVTIANGKKSKAWYQVLLVEGFFWTGANAEKFVSDKIKPDLAGVIAIDYTSTEIKDGARATIGGKTYNIVFPDNVVFQNEVIIMAVTK